MAASRRKVGLLIAGALAAGAAAPAEICADDGVARDASAAVLQARIVGAARAGDLDEVVRLVGRQRRDEILAGLAGPRTLAIATAGALGADGAPWALGALEVLSRSPDRRRARAAATAARAVAARLTAEAAAAEDLDGDALAAWSTRWLRAAARERAWIDVRVDSLEVAVALGQVARELGATSPGASSAALLRDADPAMRRAALELLSAPLPAEARAALSAELTRAGDPELARAIAAALCVDVEAAPAATLAALGAPGIARVQELARDGGRAAGDVELARCLQADGAAASRAALRELVRRAPSSWRRALGAVTRKAR